MAACTWLIARLYIFWNFALLPSIAFRKFFAPSKAPLLPCQLAKNVLVTSHKVTEEGPNAAGWKAEGAEHANLIPEFKITILVRTTVAPRDHVFLQDVFGPRLPLLVCMYLKMRLLFVPSGKGTGGRQHLVERSKGSLFLVRSSLKRVGG